MRLCGCYQVGEAKSLDIGFLSYMYLETRLRGKARDLSFRPRGTTLQCRILDPNIRSRGTHDASLHQLYKGIETSSQNMTRTFVVQLIIRSSCYQVTI